MLNLVEILDLWISWQLRAFVLSGLIVITAAPSHIRSPIWRHWVLTSGTLALILFPGLLLVFPFWTIPILPAEIFVSPFEPPLLFQYENNSVNLWVLGFCVASSLGSIILVCSYARSFMLLMRTVKNSALVSSRSMRAVIDSCVEDTGVSNKRLEVCLSLDSMAPFTLGIVRPKIVLPKQATGWTDDDLRLVLIHELQHIRRKDWLFQQAATLMTMLYPLNPLAWKIRSLTRVQAEESVDKLSLQFDIEPMVYADTLIRRLRECRSRCNSMATYMHNRADVVSRVTSLVSEPYGWPDINWSHRVAISSLAILILIPFALLQPVPQATSDKTFSWLNPLQLSLSKLEERDLPITGPLSDPVAPLNRVDDPMIVPASISYELEALRPVKLESEVNPVIPDPILNIPVEAQPLRLEMPIYPGIALRRGRESVVQVVFDLNEKGDVINPSILDSKKSSSAFERSVLNALRESKYRTEDPYGRDLITKGLTQTYVFQLEEFDSKVENIMPTQQPP